MLSLLRLTALCLFTSDFGVAADNGGQDEDQTAGPTHLLLAITPVGVPALAIMDMARQGMALLPLE